MMVKQQSIKKRMQTPEPITLKWQEYKVALKTIGDDSSELTASSHATLRTIEEKVSRAASFVAKQYLEDVKQKVDDLSTQGVFDTNQMRRTQQEI